MGRYKIWDGAETVFTYGPPYRFTPEQWLAKYPWAEVAPCVISGEGAINGAFCMPLPDMVAAYADRGVGFADGMTDEEKLDAIEAFEREQDAAAQAQAAAEASNAERQTAALEAIADGQTTENAAALDALLMGDDA